MRRGPPARLGWRASRLPSGRPYGGGPPSRYCSPVHNGSPEVVLATCAAMPGLWADDRFLLSALHRLGIRSEPVVWEDPYFDWSAPRLVVIRSAWDYAFRRAAFVEWASRVAARTRLWNSAAMVRWNTHKAYLLDLAACGVPTVPTVVLRRGTVVDLRAELRSRGWKEAVLKAAVAQSGRYAMRVTPAAVEAVQARLNRLLPHEDLLLQRYVGSVEDVGELSVVVVDGAVSHGVRKRAVGGDFRVHSDHGGSEQFEEPGARACEVALAAVAGAGERLLYARVDLVAGEDGELQVMEFEVVEPELFFRFHPPAAGRLAAAIQRELERPSPPGAPGVS